MPRGVQIRLRCRHDSSAAILIRQAGTGSDDNKKGGIICFKGTIYYCSLGFCNGSLEVKQVENNENRAIFKSHG